MSALQIDNRLRQRISQNHSLETSERPKTGKPLIISAGTADLPIAEEAAETAQILAHMLNEL